MDISVLHVVAIGAVVVLGALLSVVLFEPGLEYRIRDKLPAPASHEFLGLLAALVESPVLPTVEVEVLRDGRRIYEVELDTISRAHRSIHLEVYVFRRSRIADRLLGVLAERARAGVQVRLTLDAAGSWPTSTRYFQDLERAGGQVAWYQPFRWRALKRLNHRTHRDILVVDGETAFVGGAGVARWWDGGSAGRPAWRDTMVRIRGPMASALQSTFAENWLEATGELIAGQTEFPWCRAEYERPAPGASSGLVVTSSPSAGKATRARSLFQLLLAGAQSSIRIASPYFVPDTSLRRELAAAVRRGTRVQVLVPGELSNHPMARRASRRLYGELVRAGVEIYEFQPSMIHAKILVVDELWSVVGSTNFDNRSFGLNDEVNVAMRDAQVASELNADFDNDLVLSTRVTEETWRRRTLAERVLACVETVLGRHQ